MFAKGDVSHFFFGAARLLMGARPACRCVLAGGQLQEAEKDEHEPRVTCHSRNASWLLVRDLPACARGQK